MLLAAAAATLATLVAALAAAAAPRAHHKPAMGAPNYTLEWLGRPEVERGTGEVKLITSCINTGDESTPQTISSNFSHTFELEEGLGLNLDSLLDSLASGPEALNVTRKANTRSRLEHRVTLGKRSKSVVQFQDDVARISGKALKRYAGPPNQLPRIEEVRVTLRATILDNQSGRPSGTFSVQTFGTIAYKHPAFYNIAHRGAELNDSRSVAAPVESPYECAEHALSAGANVALFDVHKMHCEVAKVPPLASGALSLDRDGKPIGSFDLAPQSEVFTNDSGQVDKWRRERACNLIHELKSANATAYTCVNFEHRHMFLLMFKRAVTK